MCLHLPEKLRVPITHPLPLIAQRVFGFPQIRPEYTSSQIQLNCLYTHGALALVCLDGLWRDGEFHPHPLRYLTDSGALGPELLVKGVWHLRLQMLPCVKDKKRGYLRVKSASNVGPHGPTYPPFYI